MECVNLIGKAEYGDDNFVKTTHIKTEQLSQDTYYFKSGQVLAYHRHPQGDQIFMVQEGEGEYFLDEGSEESVTIKPGFAFLAPKNQWHKIVATTDLIVSQVTAQPAGLEQREG